MSSSNRINARQLPAAPPGSSGPHLVALLGLHREYRKVQEKLIELTFEGIRMQGRAGCGILDCTPPADPATYCGRRRLNPVVYLHKMPGPHNVAIRGRETLVGRLNVFE